MQKMIISIPAPCHEKWDNMTAETKGRFCLSCQKTVIDFSTMTDAEILKQISNTSGKICGKFSTEQLDRTITEQPKRKPNVFRYAWNMAIAFFIFSSKAKAQTDTIKHCFIDTPVKYSELKDITVLGYMMTRIENNNNNVVKGKIIDTLGNPVPYASVLIKNADRGVSADSAGNFNITVFDIKFPLMLSVSAVGFQSKEIYVLSSEMQPLQIQLKVREDNFLGEMRVYIVKKKKRFLPEVFKKKETPAVPKIFSPPRLTIYPNPSPSLNEVNLNLQDLAIGEWQLQMFGSNGDLIYSNNITVAGKTQIATIPGIYTKMPGLYVIQLTNASGKNTLSTKLLVQ